MLRRKLIGEASEWRAETTGRCAEVRLWRDARSVYLSARGESINALAP